MTNQTVGLKYDDGKDPWHLLPLTEVKEVVKVLAFGAKKYGPNNWQYLEEPRERYFSAMMRHMIAWREGEWLDRESGLPHLAHACCSLIFLMYTQRVERDS